MKTKQILIFVIAILFAALTFGQKAKAADWSVSVLDSESYAGQGSSIAVDSNGKIHISYMGDNTLKYATNVSGSWAVSTIDSSVAIIGTYTSIVIDSNNKIYIAYYDQINGDLKYATNAAGNWGYQVLDNNGGAFVSLALDSSNKLHISHFDGSTTTIQYITNASGSWVSSDVETLSTPTSTSIAVDSASKAYIVYYDTNNQRLRYATNVSGSWQAETLDSGGVGEYPSIAIDSNNKVHISYYDGGQQALSYITNTSGSWVESTVDIAALAGGLTGQYSHIALGANNKAHISYREVYPNYSLKYATNISGSWATTTVEQGSSSHVVGLDNSIAVDANSRVHISYLDFTNGDLKYAYTPGASLPSLSVNSGATYTNSQNVTLALSASGDPTQMVISENADFASSSWETYATSKNFTLSSGDGTKTVYAKFRDQWYAESDATSATIIYDTTAPSISASLKAGKYKTIKKIKLTAQDAGSGVDKIYYTTNGKKPTAKSNLYRGTLILTKDTTLKFFATDIAGNSSQVETAKYTIKKAKFVTKSAKKNEVLVEKKNAKYSANDFDFLFKSFPKKLQKSKYYLELQRLKKYPTSFSNAKKSALKKYWTMRTNLDKYTVKNKKDRAKIKLTFKYSNKEFNLLKKQNKGLKEKDLVLKYYDSETKEWQKIDDAVHNLKKNTFTAETDLPFSADLLYFAIGVK